MSRKSKMSRRGKTPEKIDIIDVICPICKGILIEPVSMPCKHVLCLECFEKTMTMANLVCPLCRKRLSSWLRKSKKENKLIDLGLWEHIQKNHSKEIQAKFDGDEVDTQSLLNNTPLDRLISSQGEIRHEFQMQRKIFEDEDLKRRQEEEKASIEFIKKIQAEELPMIQKKRQETEPAATATCSNLNCDSLSNKENKKSKSILDCFPSIGKRFIRERNQHLASTDNHENIDRCKVEQNRSISAVSTSSHDSINQELHHFKPIKIAPRTPPKRLYDGQIVEPKVIKTTPVNINLIYDSLEKGNESTFVCNSFNQKLLAIKKDCLNSSKNQSDSAFKGCGINKDNSASGDSTSTPKKMKLDPEIEKYIENGEISSEFASEQRRLQELIEIENSDSLLALRLAQEWSNETSSPAPKERSPPKSTSKTRPGRRSSVRLQPKRQCKQRTLDDMFTQTKPAE